MVVIRRESLNCRLIVAAKALCDDNAPIHSRVTLVCLHHAKGNRHGPTRTMREPKSV